MPFIPVIDVIKLVPEFRLPDDQLAVNVLYFAVPTDQAPELLETAISYYEQWFSETAAPLMSNQVSLVKITATDMSVESGQQVIHPVSPPLPGENVSAMNPAQVSFCTSFRTGYSGRNKRGRAYWIGVTETGTVGSFLTSVYADAIRSAWADLKAIMLPENLTHVVVSKSLLVGTPPNQHASYNGVTEYVNVTTRVATQRRRLPGSGS